MRRSFDVNECSLPYTGRAVVQRIITDLCVIDVTPASEGGGLKLVELTPGVTAEEVREKTEPTSWRRSIRPIPTPTGGYDRGAVVGCLR